jgi:hypothetical protein
VPFTAWCADFAPERIAAQIERQKRDNQKRVDVLKTEIERLTFLPGSRGDLAIRTLEREVDQLRAGPAIPQLIAPFTPGDVGLLTDGVLRVSKVISSSEMMANFEYFRCKCRDEGGIEGSAEKRLQSIHLKGIATGNRKEGEIFELSEVIGVTGFDDQGRIKSIVVVEPFDIKPYLK